MATRTSAAPARHRARPLVAVAAALAVLLAAGCADKPQTATSKRMDEKAWAGTQSPTLVQGWKVGDQAAWEEQLRKRAQSGQNEYNRAATTP